MKKSNKIKTAIYIIAIIGLGGWSVYRIARAVVTHCAAREYSQNAWTIVWPVIVSTLIAIFGTLVTSYVFLKDTLDRTVEERPYYEKVIGEYRQKRMRMLLWYSISFIGISCYLILFQNAYVREEKKYNFLLYIGIIFVVLLLCSSIIFLYHCINIDNSIYKSAQEILNNIESEAEERWAALSIEWQKFIEEYIEDKIGETDVPKFLEVEINISAVEAENYKKARLFDEEKFIAQFSGWEKFILLFQDKSFESQKIRTSEQKIRRVTDYVNNLGIIPRIEMDDAVANKWKTQANVSIWQYRDILTNKMKTGDFLKVYCLLSEYRDALQVIQDKKNFSAIPGKWQRNRKNRMEGRKKNDEFSSILYLFFLFRFYTAEKCLIAIPKVELFYPGAKMYHADFYNVRFENTSFRASSFHETSFTRIKMIETNMALSQFIDCNFYNADIRNCALSNCLFQSCLMSEMILSDVDVTGTHYKDVDLRETTFDNAVIVNVEFHESEFEHTSFINCKLTQVDFFNVKNRQLRRISFDKSIMKNVSFQVKTGHTQGIQSPEKSGEYNENPFSHMSVQLNGEGRKERERTHIWDGLESGEDGHGNLDMSSSSFLEVSAEGLLLENIILASSIFSHANLQKSHWENVCIQGCVMDEVNLVEAEFANVNMESCAMSEAILFGAKFCFVNLQNSNMAGCHASGSVWKSCILDKSDISRIDLTGSDIEYSSFRDVIMPEGEFTDTFFKDVLFENSNGRSLLSSYSRFESCCFTNAFLAESNFNYTVFENCCLNLASMAGSTIEEAEFQECDFENSNFRNCCFIKVCFEDNKNLSRELFQGCTFIGCSFKGADKKWERIFRNNGLIIE